MAATLGRRIAGKRVENDWTQGELARRAGISGRYLSRVERDLADPSTSVLIRISRALDTSLDYLTEGER